MSTHTPFKGITKVVRSHQLEIETACGYVILDSFDEDDVEMVCGTEPLIQADPHQTYHNGTCNTTRHLVARHRAFLLGKPEESVLADLNSQIQGLGMSLNDARDEAANLKIENKKLAVAAEELGRTLDLNATRSATARVELEAEKARGRKMEGDLGKIRQAIGALKMREILGEEATQ